MAATAPLLWPIRRVCGPAPRLRRKGSQALRRAVTGSGTAQDTHGDGGTGCEEKCTAFVRVRGAGRAHCYAG